MNKRKNQQLNIRNKLFAAIAMLLVSSIMMVSTTYAWFTLSTAPEVQGITTTVGANGALEIALLPSDGSVTGISSDVGDSNQLWAVKNTTWGNLLSMTEKDGTDIYGLDDITLLPTQLLGSSGTETGTFVLNTNPLGRPAYGSDGRVSELKRDTSIGGREIITTTTGEGADATTTIDLGEDFVGNGAYGVRAVGVASGLTENQRVKNDGLSMISSGMSGAVSAASQSLSANGQALANIMLAKGLGAEDYVSHVPSLRKLIDSLSTSLAQIDNALKGALLVAASTVEDEATFNLAVDAINGATDIEAVIDAATSNNVTLPSGFQNIVDMRNALETKISGADSELTAIANNTTVTWGQILTVVDYLMDYTDGDVTLNGETISAILGKGTTDLAVLALDMKTNGAELVLGEDSGVYYDIHEIAGKIVASTQISVKVSDLPDEYQSLASAVADANGNINIPTTISTEFDGTPALSGAYAAANEMNPAGSAEGDTVAVLDVLYGYVLDLVFRTNASNSNLQLQTDAINRIYSDSTSANTMGNGSTITFTMPTVTDSDDTEEATDPTDASDATDATDATEATTADETDETTGTVDARTQAIVKGLLEGIRVVFFDPDTNEIFGIAIVTNVSINGNQMVGTLTLGNITSNGSIIEVSAVEEPSKTLCELSQNVAKKVSVMVCLDGNNIDNSNVLAENNITGTLNLQFSSDADLVPMEDINLKTGVEESVATSEPAAATDPAATTEPQAP